MTSSIYDYIKIGHMCKNVISTGDSHIQKFSIIYIYYCCTSKRKQNLLYFLLTISSITTLQKSVHAITKLSLKVAAKVYYRKYCILHYCQATVATVTVLHFAICINLHALINHAKCGIYIVDTNFKLQVYVCMDIQTLRGHLHWQALYIIHIIQSTNKST